MTKDSCVCWLRDRGASSTTEDGPTDGRTDGRTDLLTTSTTDALDPADPTRSRSFTRKHGDDDDDDDDDSQK